MTRSGQRVLRTALPLGLAALVLAACAPEGGLSEQYREGSNKNYIAGDGTVAEWAMENRGDPVEFTGTLEDGTVVDAADYRGSVLVVNFWYAACAPCRAEAPDLEAINQEYAGEAVQFLGVNIRDQADTAIAFADTYKVTYPSIIDSDGLVSLAFAGEFAANAVPTTIVVDTEGRPAARILGRIESQSILSTLIADTLAESAP